MTETIFERHAWKVLAGIGIIIGLFGVSDLIGGAADLRGGEVVLMHRLTGMSWSDLASASPGAANLIEWKFRSDGASLITIGYLCVAVCLSGFRRGERWAWIAMWAMPVWLALTVFTVVFASTYPGSDVPVPVISGTVLLVLSLMALGLSRRKFFWS